MLYALLFPLASQNIVFNVFKYITFRAFGALLTSLFLYFVLGRFQILFLQRWQVIQMIRNDGPKSHLEKAGTPTMGGILILFCVTLSTLLWMNFSSLYVWFSLIIFAAYALTGFWDDYRKLRYGSAKGLQGRYKLVCQFLFAGVVALLLYYHAPFESRLSFPFFKTIQPDLGWCYIPFALLVVVGSSNAVNLTDGLDGLASGPLVTSYITYAVLAYLTGHIKIATYLQIPYIEGVGELAVFCAGVVGALVGFLWYNTYPAQIFMGDVGSLPLGGALGLVALMTKHEMLLVIVGGIFVLEAVSVISQVISFKLTGKRIFRMAPIHHHFELKGWEEPKVIVRFWIISFILSLVALSTLKLR